MLAHARRRCAAVLAAACAFGPAAAKELVYDPAEADVTPAPLAGACTVIVTGIEDQRADRPAIGGNPDGQVTGDAVRWLDTTLDRLRRYGYRVERGAAPAGAVAVNVRLARLYNFTWLSHIGAMVALEVDVSAPGRAPVPLKLRSRLTRMHWTGGERVSSLNYAASEVVDRMAVALQSHCPDPLPQPAPAA